MNSHFVSRALLRRFLINGKLISHNVYNHSENPRSPEQVSYIKLPSEVILPLETEWSVLEDKMNKLFPLIDNGTILFSKENRDIIKQFLALHFIRSQALYTFMVQDSDKYFEQAINDSIKNKPDSEAEILKNRPLYRKQWDESLRTRILPGIYKSKSEDIKGYVMEQEIEIAVVTGKYEIALSDTPVINLDDSGRQGILQGVPINESTSCIIPLGPRHVVALTNRKLKTDYTILQTYSVERINHYSVNQSAAYYYYRKNSKGILHLKK